MEIRRRLIHLPAFFRKRVARFGDTAQSVHIRAGKIMTKLIVRYGPAPGATKDAQGKLHATFTGFALISESLNNFDQTVAAIWAQVLAEGHGHVLVGTYESFEYVSQLGPQSCGWGTTKNGISFSPKNYKPLYAVARSDAQSESGDRIFVDYAIDYRNIAVQNVAPVVYGSGPYPAKKDL